jgi:hypothetical protein
MRTKSFLYIISLAAFIAVGVLSIFVTASFERQFGSLAALIVLGLCLLTFFTFFLTRFRRWAASRETQAQPLAFVISFAAYAIIAVALVITIRIARQTNETVFWVILALLCILSFFSVKQERMSSPKPR